MLPERAREPSTPLTTPEEIVRSFLEEVRSGRDPDSAEHYMAEVVVAHQLTSEAEHSIRRTPSDYAAHVREFLDAFGSFSFEVVDLISSDGRVYARWKQTGRHQQSTAGEEPTGAALVEIASAVYRVHGGKIVEYWIQADRKGLELQIAAAVEANSRRLARTLL